MNFFKSKISKIRTYFEQLFSIPNMDIDYAHFDELERKKYRPRTIREELFF